MLQYNTKLGKKILSAKANSLSASGKYWFDQCLEVYFLRKSWQQFWGIEQARNVTIFHWFVIHKVVTVQEWSKLPNVSSICPECNLASESIRHCMWDCVHAKGVWYRMLWIFQVQKMFVNIVWGSMVWNTLRSNVFKYDSSFGTTNSLEISQILIKKNCSIFASECNQRISN